MTKKSDPTRTCVGCRQRRPTQELLRVRQHDGELTFEPTVQGRPTGGRGAWLCAGSLQVCARSAQTSRAFDRAFRNRVPVAAVDALQAAIESLAELGTDCAADADDGGRLANRR